ncbi:nucleoside-diphosphate sugar epimerase/dehydratase [Halioxenophilus sp. WMMB6]|uniref:polysaccharide biosynthesis protein n=1 Tax=Halioxenophilus sp. WMMB6 TaxID=3073815 RepID=UPI00295EF161|nr:nucleoside-diphosphate sugar epimerase/dehydratase [Halioxenophilus sp. WMMB6]
MAYDLCVIPLAIYSAILLRVGDLFNPIEPKLLLVVAITTTVTITCFIRLGLYRAILRFMTHQAVITVIICTLISAASLIVSAYFLNLQIAVTDTGRNIPLPRSTPFIYSCIALVVLGTPRMLVRSIVHLFLNTRGRSAGNSRQPIIIYGAGHTGYQIAGSLIQSGAYDVIAFLDDDCKMRNTTVRGITVHSPSEAKHLVNLYGVKTILLALGLTSKANRLRVVERMADLGVRIQTVPTVEDLVFGTSSGNDIRDIEIEDLLGRDPIPPRQELLDRCIRGKVVMVTGAGGSIGSELCRQLSPEEPRLLVLFEQNEFALYKIERELTSLFPNLRTLAILGSTLNRKQMRETIQAYSVETIYHAAAYKHVPLVEQNLVEGVRNNVLGTWECLRAAVECEIQNFVLISTDKAVRPTNVMGASKRVAELLVQAYASTNCLTRLSMVRFGNVLGSSGSVVPLFKQQIEAGGPITVTHKNITRYFMTIPEAAQLVIQASAMAQGGDIFVLDMGEPVKIWNLAERMVRMSGLSLKTASNPNGEIEIVQIGLRPGEKLYEELLVGDQVTGTEHPLIMRATEQHLSWPETQKLIAELEYACASYDIGYVKKLITVSPVHYTPELVEHDLLAKHRSRVTPISGITATVTQLPTNTQV